jgi:hypothetical protein
VGVAESGVARPQTVTMIMQAHARLAAVMAGTAGTSAVAGAVTDLGVGGNG